MPRKPDRFERDIRKCTLYGNGSCTPKLISIHDAVVLLRKEHRWVERLVKKAAASVENGIEPGAARNGYLMACNELLKQLKQRRK